MIPFRTPFACLLFALLLALSVCGPSRAEENHNYIASLEAAAARGDVEAQYNLGLLYDLDQGVRQDYQKAIEWYEKAAAQGYAAAQYNLAVFYHLGQCVRQDYQKAREWLEKSAAQGYAGAQCLLGTLYEKGNGVRQDLATAKEYYKKACDNGFMKGCGEYHRLNAEGK